MRRGLTLVEMLVVLVLLGVIAGVAAVALPPAVAPVSPALNALAAARRAAIRSGRSVTVAFSWDSQPARPVTALPDGRVVADSAVPVDLFTGRVNAPR
jgi:prepilin-type N-terminal cleavage/methylation domain-containing protein